MIGALIALLYDEARRIWCYKWLALTTAICIFAVAAAYVMRMPSVYDAWGQIFVNKQTPVAAAASGVSLVGDGYGSPYFVQKTLLNDQNLETVVERLNPSAHLGKAGVAQAVANLKSRIVIAPDQGDGFFEFHVRDSDGTRARDVVQLLLNEFVSRNLTRNQQELRQAGKFLDDQIASYETMLADSQVKISEFRSQNPAFATVPVALGPDPGSSDLPAAQATYAALLAQSGGAPAAAPKASAAAAQVAALEARITALRTQYTDQYPDVVTARRQLATAIADRDREAQAEPAAVSAPSANPALDAARRRLEIAQRRSRPRIHVAPTASPAAQSAWSELQRNDEVLRLNYQQLIARREATRLSEAVYGADGSGKYQVTRQPTVPDFPIGPNRRLFLMVAAVAAVGGGLAAAYLRAAILGIFISPRELEHAFQLPVVGTVAWEPAWCTKPARRSLNFLRTLRAAMGRNVASMTFRSLQ